MCPTHGTIGNLCKVYLASSGRSIIDTSPKLYPRTVSEPSTYIIGKTSTESWIEGCELYVMKVDITDPVKSNITPCTYVSARISCVVQGSSYVCTRYFSHPLYNHSADYEDGIGVVVDSTSQLGPFKVDKVRLLNGVSSNVRDKDLPTVDCEYEQICAGEHRASVCYRNECRECYSIMVLCDSYSGLIRTLEHSYRMVSGTHTRLYNGSFSGNWLFQVLSTSNVSDRAVLHIPQDMMLGDEDGAFVSGPGAPSVLYVNNRLCIVIYIKDRRCILLNSQIVDTHAHVCGSFKSYATEDRVYIDKPIHAASYSVDAVLGSSILFDEVTRSHTSNWREFTPACCQSVVVRPAIKATLSPSLGDHSMEVILGILSRCIDSVMKELLWNCIIIYGEPTHAFIKLMRDYECHYVYPHNWSDDIADMEQFHSLHVHHYGTIRESHSNFMIGSFGIAISDDGYNELEPGALSVYLPSYRGSVVSRNEFDVYLAIGLPQGTIKPYNSTVVEFSSTNIASVLSSVHVEIPDMNLMFHPSVGAYMDIM